MAKILLCCTAGVTSNMFVSKMQEAANAKDVKVTIWAAAELAAEYSIEDADIVVVAPQLAGSVKKLKDLAKPGTPFMLISSRDFEAFDAESVLDQALALI